MPLMQISVVPIGTGDTGLSEYVAGVIKVLQKEKGIKYEFHSMSTVVEADSIATLFKIAKKMHAAPFRNKVKRVYTIITIDDRRDKK